MSPLSEEAQKLYHNSPALLFTASAQHTNEQQSLAALGSILGTHWSRETVDAMFAPDDPKKQRERIDKIVIPHLLGVQPQLQEYLRDRFGSSAGIQAPAWYTSDRGEVVEGWDMDRAEFMKIAGMFTGHIPADYLDKIR